MSKTLYDKIWENHLVHKQDDGTCLIYVDRHLVHEVTRETSWSTMGFEDEVQGITFDGRGWQKRTGSILHSSELGNGSLSIN